MQNIIQRVVTVTDSYAPPFPSRLIGTVTVTCLPGNAGTVYILSDDGLSDVPWAPGECVDFHSVDLASFQIKGTPGDKLTFKGNSGGAY